ncbi:MAG: hypothetical protein WCS97_02865 [Candidatus Paceibacterota bacterium]|jgi:hypothetical protein
MRTLKTIGVIGSVAAILLSTTVVFAREQATSTQGENQKGEQRGLIATTTQREDGKTARERMKVVRDEALARMAMQREKAAQRLVDIQDKAKQEMAQKLANQFENLNSTWTDRFLQLLDHYDALVQKIQSRANIAVGNGKDVASTTAAIKSAQDAIAAARTAVVAQAAKTYTLDPSTIPTTATTTSSGQEKIMKSLRTSFKSLHTTLFADLFALRDGTMKDARKAVQSALQTLGAIPGVDDNKNATSTEARNK